MVYFGFNDGNLYVVIVVDGFFVWNLKIEGVVVVSFIVVLDGIIYVGFYDKFVYVIDGKSGFVLWSINF